VRIGRGEILCRGRSAARGSEHVDEVSDQGAKGAAYHQGAKHDSHDLDPELLVIFVLLGHGDNLLFLNIQFDLLYINILFLKQGSRGRNLQLAVRLDVLVIFPELCKGFNDTLTFF